MRLSNEEINQIIDRKIQSRDLKDSGKEFPSNRDIAGEVLGNRKAESTVRRIWKSVQEKGHYLDCTGTNAIAGGSISTPEVNRIKPKGKKFVITSAQNNTRIHEDFLKSLEGFCEAEGAELLISPYYYNKNGFQNGKKEEAWFDKRIQKYLTNDSIQLAEGLVFCGELNILPTAVNPLSGFYNYTGEQSAIIPHAKLQLESLATHKDTDPKFLYTTGTVTQRNYIQQKAGQKAEWHHTFSALYVYVDDDGDWFVRQLNAESSTGCFYDLLNYYTPKGKDGGSWGPTAINLGDVHADKLRDDIAAICWRNENSMVRELWPNYVFLHDVHDHARRNHHNVKDIYFLFQQFTDNKESVMEEVLKSGYIIEELSEIADKVVVVESNHDLALERWLKEQDYRKDPVNALFFLEMQLENYRRMAEGKPLQTFKTACELLEVADAPNIRFLKTDESIRLHDIEFGQHGHNGANGSRGSLSSFVRQGNKYNVGHSHACAIKDGVYVAGACVEPDDVGYAKGASSWSVSHILTYANGKRTIITCKNGKWR